MTNYSASVLLLYANYTFRLSYFDDWLDAFKRHPGLKVTEVDICRGDADMRITLGLKNSDLVVLMHSTNGDGVQQLESVTNALSSRQVPLVSFVGNEVNIPGIPISEKRRVLQILAPDYVASQLPIDAAEFLWGDLVQRRVLAVPHALNPVAFSPTTPFRERPIGIGVRGARYSATLGDLERNRVVDLFGRLERVAGQPVDISTEKLNRTEWARFLNRSRATVSSESGGWFLEKDDRTMIAITDWVHALTQSRLSLKGTGRVVELKRKLPEKVQDLIGKLAKRTGISLDVHLIEQMDPEEVITRFFTRPRPDYYAKCISSRHFDAIGTRTVQVLLEGRYNGCLTPGEHYIELKSTFGNLHEVTAQLTDPTFCETISAQALDHSLENHTYAHRIQNLIDTVLGNDLEPPMMSPGGVHQPGVADNDSSNS